MDISDSYLLPSALWLVGFTVGTILQPSDFALVLQNSKAPILGAASMLIVAPAIGITLAIVAGPSTPSRSA